MPASHLSSESRSPSFMAVLVLLVMLGSGVTAPPVFGDEDVRLSPVRRTTILTYDPERSLAFYRDLLGFSVEYDVQVTDPAQLSLISPGASAGRSIALRQGARLGGSIGLSWTDTLKPRTDSCDAAASAGDVGILILTDNLAALHRRLRSAGVTLLADEVSYDQSRGPTDAFTVFDPDCIRVVFAQIAQESFEESIAR